MAGFICINRKDGLVREPLCSLQFGDSIRNVDVRKEVVPLDAQVDPEVSWVVAQVRNTINSVSTGCEFKHAFMTIGQDFLP